MNIYRKPSQKKIKKTVALNLFFILTIMIHSITNAGFEKHHISRPETFKKAYEYGFFFCRHQLAIFNDEWRIKDIDRNDSYTPSWKTTHQKGTANSTIRFSRIFPPEYREQEEKADKSDKSDRSDRADGSDGSDGSDGLEGEEEKTVEYKTPFKISNDDKLIKTKSSLFIFYKKQQKFQQLKIMDGKVVEIACVDIDLSPPHEQPFHLEGKMTPYAGTFQCYDSDSDSDDDKSYKNRDSYAFLITTPHPESAHRSLFFSYDNLLLCYHWPEGSKTIKPTCAHRFSEIDTLTLSPDGKTIAVTSAGSIWLFDIDEKSQLQEITQKSTPVSPAVTTEEKPAVTGVVFNPVYKNYFSSYSPHHNSLLWFIDRSKNTITHVADIVRNSPMKDMDNACFSPDGKWYIEHDHGKIGFYFFDPDMAPSTEIKQELKPIQWFHQTRRHFCHATVLPCSKLAIVYFTKRSQSSYEATPKYYQLMTEEMNIIPKGPASQKEIAKFVDVSGHKSGAIFLTLHHQEVQSEQYRWHRECWQTWTYDQSMLAQ